MMSSLRAKNTGSLDTVSSTQSAGRILDAALALIARKGDANVTMAQIARAARMSRQAVYLHFSDRAALMIALARHLDERLGLPADIQHMMDAPTGVAMIEVSVSVQARRNPSVWAVARALEAVRRSDAAAERAWQDRLQARLEGCRAIVERLQAEGSLRRALDPSIAADLLWTFTSLRMWEDLVLVRGWSPAQYQQQITRLLVQMLTQKA